MKKRMTILLVITATLLLTGCQSQDGGMQVDLVKWDNNGLRIGSLETNGSQVAVWKPDEANTRFNNTIREENIYNHEEEIATKESSLTKELAKQGRPTSEIKSLSLTERLLMRKQQ